MRKEYYDQCIHTLSAMIATFSQAGVIGGRSKQDTVAMKALTDARLKVIEASEATYGLDDATPDYSESDLLDQAGITREWDEYRRDGLGERG